MKESKTRGRNRKRRGNEKKMSKENRRDGA